MYVLKFKKRGKESHGYIHSDTHGHSQPKEKEKRKISDSGRFFARESALRDNSFVYISTVLATAE
jgi:hypothetical protein